MGGQPKTVICDTWSVSAVGVVSRCAIAFTIVGAFTSRGPLAFLHDITQCDLVSLEYACEKMNQVVDALATGYGTLQERLAFAIHPPFDGAVHDAQLEDYLPSDLLIRTEAIQTRISALDPGAEGQEKINATLNAMPDSEAAEIASEMIEVAYRIWRVGIRTGVYWWWTEDG